jgi:uncharacterized protein YggE
MLHKTIAAIALLLASLAVSASQLPDYPFIHVTGGASTYVLPDIGTIDFEIIAADADPAAARSVVETRVGEIRALVEAQGLSADDLEVRDVRQELRKNQAHETPPVYEVRCTVHLKVRELTKWTGLAGGLLGMQNLDGFATAFDTTEHDKVETNLSGVAIRDAQRKAEALAAGFGRKLGPVSAVTPGSLKNLANAMGLVREDLTYRRDAQASQAQRVDRDNLVNVIVFSMAMTVDVIFRIK